MRHATDSGRSRSLHSLLTLAFPALLALFLLSLHSRTSLAQDFPRDTEEIDGDHDPDDDEGGAEDDGGSHDHKDGDADDHAEGEPGGDDDGDVDEGDDGDAGDEGDEGDEHDGHAHVAKVRIESLTAGTGAPTVIRTRYLIRPTNGLSSHGSAKHRFFLRQIARILSPSGTLLRTLALEIELFPPLAKDAAGFAAVNTEAF